MRGKFKPLVGYGEKDNLFIDVEFLEKYRKSDSLGQGYSGLILGLGENVFLFDVSSCEYMNKRGEKLEVTEEVGYSTKRARVKFNWIRKYLTNRIV